MLKLIEKRLINFITLKFKENDLEKKYQQYRSPSLIIPYIYNLVTLFVMEIVIFIMLIINTSSGNILWICGGIFGSLVPIIIYVLIYHQNYSNAQVSLSCPQTSDNSIVNPNQTDLLLFLYAHETITLSQAFFIDFWDFSIDSLLIIVNRIINGVIFGNQIRSNAFLNILFYLVPIFLILNRYIRELTQRSKFLDNNNNSEWVNIIDNMYNSCLIVSRWDDRHQTIQMIRVSANAETKYKIFDGESMKNFYSKIIIDIKSSEGQLNGLAEDGKKLTLKDYLLSRCVLHKQQRSRKQTAYRKKQPKSNTPLSTATKTEDLKQELQAKRLRCKSQHQRNLVESETLIGYYYRQGEDQKYSRIFRIKVSNFQMNESALVTCIEDITYQDDIKYFQNSKIQSDKLLLQTLNDFRIKLVPIIRGVVEFEKANLDEQYDNIVETIKYNTYLIMNHIYVLFDYFSINEKKGVNVKMAQFSFKQMIWDLVGMFQAQAKMNDIQFIHKNDVRRMDKTFSDERRIKQVLITILSNAINQVGQGSISFKVCLERNDFNVTQSQTDSPTSSKSHPSLRFEIEVQIKEKKKKRDDVNEDFEQMFKKIESQVIDELVKTLGPYQIKAEDIIENNTLKTSFAIYADFVNLRKEERLHSLIRPEVSINYQQQQRNRASTKQSTLFQQRKSQKSIESAPVKTYGQTYTQHPIEKQTQEQQVVTSKKDFNQIEENNKEQQTALDTKDLVEQQLKEFQEQKQKLEYEKQRQESMSPKTRFDSKGQIRSTTIRPGSNILNSSQHKTFLQNLSRQLRDTTIINQQNQSSAQEENEDNQNSFSQNKIDSKDSRAKLSNYHFQEDNNQKRQVDDCNNNSINFSSVSQHYLDEENLGQSELGITDQETNIQKLYQPQFNVDSYIGNKFSSYFSKQSQEIAFIEGDKSNSQHSNLLLGLGDKSISKSNSDEMSQSYFINEKRDSVNEQLYSSDKSYPSQLEIRPKKASLFSQIR
ncbi:transmembrane protein, putative (macronuclear) [Tetrahymena thermophila SB210]|uniref:Transmembrane protein, putative n=1 Tax=Tetrahymena thermophila (strain SB210) TaxID=312017 RepID=I7M6L1_TETTS|nr:transmembrane protein, putative [Tetrahymena thermophila SB210]EAR85411.2 transmembrane protein, putative [Tetrahymena thermophila SB210]|eukprot:XP_001033074.2 transmembrane protein, putative [Tetrahymena thermophila SB210]